MGSLQSSRHATVRGRGQKLRLLLISAVQIFPRHLIVRLFAYALFTYCDKVVNNLEISPDGIGYGGVLSLQARNRFISHSQGFFLENAVSGWNGRDFLLRRELRLDRRLRSIRQVADGRSRGQYNPQKSAGKGGALKSGP